MTRLMALCPVCRKPMLSEQPHRHDDPDGRHVYYVLDPDPLDVSGWEGTRDRRTRPRRFGCSVFALAILLAFVVSGATSRAAPEPSPDQGQPGTPQPGERPVTIGQTSAGAPLFPAVATRSQPVGAPTSTPGPANPRLTSQRLAVASSLIVGVASWYPARGDIAAVHSWRFGDDPYWANVCTFGSGAARCVSVYVSDYMANPRRAIDLSDDAFRQLAPLSVGVLRVTVEVPKVPETDR